MTRPVRDALTALAATLFALLVLSNGFLFSSEQKQQLAVIEEAGTHNNDGSANPKEAVVQARGRDRRDSVSDLGRKTPARTTATATIAATTPGYARGAVSPPYGLRRQRSGAVPAVLQVFRC
ncbi:hypothetical protein Ssi03_41630 [Sphaerisporangium siamense]|uniref:Uncharacterized protein n=1 Tax=Sphaerisporangium siamense TaxID=795645 RepID=A0A7W7GD39_9ACTN|nr:hypothetical protein [Sphaerisporangium siamense]MBB4704560.1 hypothetical protein [Sphaerisporangium siamense]GII86173.1 hypothetical protein Ssi03_41630 [Sphaerisporangium siamense]